MLIAWFKRAHIVHESIHKTLEYTYIKLNTIYSVNGEKYSTHIVKSVFSKHTSSKRTSYFGTVLDI